MSTGLAVFLVLLGLAVFAFNLWLFIVGVQYLRTVTRAARRYLEVTDHPRPLPPPPLAPSAPTSTAPPSGPSPHTRWNPGQGQA